MKSYKLNICLFFFVVLLFITAFFTDWLAGIFSIREHQILGLSTPIKIERNPEIELTQDIINNLSNIREFSLQRGISGIPVISNIKFFEALSVKPSPHSPLLISIDASGFLQRIIANNQMYSFGGLILFSSNLAKLKNKNELINYIDKLRNFFRFSVYVEIAGETQIYKVTIEPLISADCDLSYSKIEYCRYPFSKPTVDDKGSWLASIKDFRDVGFSSMLGPKVDLSASENGDEMTSFAKEIVHLKQNNRLLPVLKHFGYDPKILNAHYETKLLDYDGDRFEEILKPYVAVEKLNIDYGIMLTHHSLMIDKNIPLPFSIKVKQYIEKKFPHSITIADEIKMAGLSKNNDLYTVTKNLQTDMFIFHSGNIKFNVNPVISSLKSNFSETHANSVRRVLMLKNNLGLLTIEKM
jgi:hypothetical protein